MHAPNYYPRRCRQWLNKMCVLLFPTDAPSTFDMPLIDAATDKQSLKCPDIKLVNVDWLLDSTNNKKRSDESSYLLTPSTSATATPAASSQTRSTRSKGAQASQANGNDKNSSAQTDPPAKKTKETSKKATGKRKRDEVSVDKADTPERTDVDPTKLKVPVDSPRHAQCMFPPVAYSLSV